MGFINDTLLWLTYGTRATKDARGLKIDSAMFETFSGDSEASAAETVRTGSECLLVANSAPQSSVRKTDTCLPEICFPIHSPFPPQLGLESLTILEILGQGAFGTVSKATVQGHVVATKRIKIDPNFMNREAEILSMLPSHPNLVEFYGSRKARTPKGEMVEYLVMEYMPTNLRQFMASTTENGGSVPLLTALHLMHQLFAGLGAVHEPGICHRDLKPENVLVGADGCLKLCDFGSAKRLSSGAVAGVTYIGSRPYRAPELLCQFERYTHAIDIWASGCIFAELLSGTPLFNGAQCVAVLARQVKIRGNPTAEWFAELCGNPGAMDLLKTKRILPGSCKPWRKVLRRPEWSPKHEGLVSCLLNNLLAWAPSIRPLATLAAELFAHAEAEIAEGISERTTT